MLQSLENAFIFISLRKQKDNALSLSKDWIIIGINAYYYLIKTNNRKKDIWIFYEHYKKTCTLLREHFLTNELNKNVEKHNKDKLIYFEYFTSTTKHIVLLKSLQLLEQVTLDGISFENSDIITDMDSKRIDRHHL